MLALLLAASVPAVADADIVAEVERAAGSPWSEEGVGGEVQHLSGSDLVRDLGDEVYEVEASLMSAGPSGWLLDRPPDVPVSAPELPVVDPPAPSSLLPDERVLAAPVQLADAATSEAEAQLAGARATADQQALDARGAADDAAKGVLHLLAVADAPVLPGLLRMDAAQAGVVPADAPSSADPVGARGAAGVRGTEPPTPLALDAWLSGPDLAMPGALAQAPPPAAAGPAPGLRAGAARALPPAATVPLALAVLGGILAGFLLYHRVREESSLEHPSRRALYQAIVARPGCTIQSAARMAGLSRGTAVHHLRMLARHRLVTQRPGTKEVHLFPNTPGFEGAAGAHLALLARPRTRQVGQLVAAHPGLTRTQVAGAVGISPSTLDWHLRSLMGSGLVTEQLVEGRRALLPTAGLAQALATSPSAALHVAVAEAVPEPLSLPPA